MSQRDIGDENNQTRNDETSFNRLRELLLRVIEEDDYVPNDCRHPEHDESEIASVFTDQNRIYYERANNNDDSCQYYIANSFRKGNDQFPVDKSIAFKYMKKSASHGNKLAIFGLAYLMKPSIERDDDIEKAEKFVKMLKISTFFDSEHASFTLGQLYSIGFHVERNYVISLIYLKFSADKGYPPAMLMFADRLRKIVNNIISRDEIQRMKEESNDFLNDQRGINEINHKFRTTAASIFNFLEDPQLADTISRIYYINAIENEKSSEQQKNYAHAKLTKLENNELIDDYTDDEYVLILNSILR